MERKKETLAGVRVRGERSLTVGAALTAMLPLLPLLPGLWLLLEEAFPSLPLPWWALAFLCMVLCAAVLALMGSPLRRWVTAAGLGLTAACCLVFRNAVFPGVITLVNDVLTGLTAVTGRICLEYGGGGSALPALVPVCLLLALLCSAAALRGSLLPLLPVLLPLIAGTALGLLSSGPGLALFALGVILLAGGGCRSLGAVTGRAAVTAACAVIALLAGLALKDADLAAWREAGLERIHVWRYDSGTNSLPEGRLADLGPWRKSDAPALEVTMSAPGKQYLRGHIYEVYTGTAWEGLPAETLADSEALFYWLHKNGFYGQSQIAGALELNGGEPERMTVRILSACRENAYLPYGFADGEKLDAAVIGDTKTPGELTDFALYNGGVTEWYEAQYLLTAAQDEPEIKDWLALEESFREYVTGRDLLLTQESWNVLYRQLGEVSGTRSLAEIQKRIREYLEAHMHYAENVYTLSGNGDFLHYVLESSDGGGWSVQYATAAALMLRYFGVPSRYVEGYYLTPEQAERAEAGEPVTLTEKNAHAWAELYLNGVGFIPFEVTPGYVDPEDMPSGGASEESGSSGPLFAYEANETVYEQLEEPEVQTPESQPKELPLLSPLLLWLPAALALLMLLAFLLHRRLRLRRKLREIDRAGDREAVAMRYGYALALKRRAEDPGLPEDAAAAHLNELALFSPREITGAERTQMDVYAEKVLEACRGKWTAWEKLRLRWIEGIY